MDRHITAGEFVSITGIDLSKPEIDEIVRRTAMIVSTLGTDNSSRGREPAGGNQITRSTDAVHRKIFSMQDTAGPASFDEVSPLVQTVTERRGAISSDIAHQIGAHRKHSPAPPQTGCMTFNASRDSALKFFFR